MGRKVRRRRGGACMLVKIFSSEIQGDAIIPYGVPENCKELET
jgi:hypothetical protein